MCVYVQNELMNYEIDTINPPVQYFRMYHIEKQNLVHHEDNYVGVLQKRIVSKMA